MSTQLTSRGPYPKGIKRRQQIVEAAARVFAQYGYKNGSLRQIANEVGVSAPTLVSHFGQKEALLIAVWDYWSEQSAVLSAGYSGLAYFEWLPRLMEYHTAHRGFIELFLTLATEASDPGHPARDFMVNRYEMAVEEMSGHLREALDKGEILPLSDSEIASEVRGVIALLDGDEIQWLLNPDLDLVRLVSIHLDVVLARWTGKPRQESADAPQ
jgi:AcrR family transcriptional regulator